MMTSTEPRKKKLSTNFLTTVGPGHIFTQAVGKLAVKPQEQSRMSLGVFSNNEPPGGFLVEIHSDDTDDSVVARVVSVGTQKRYELVLHVANYGSKTITTDVWRM